MLDFTDADEAISDSPILSLTPRASLASTASSTDVGAIDDLPISQRVRVCGASSRARKWSRRSRAARRRCPTRRRGPRPTPGCRRAHAGRNSVSDTRATPGGRRGLAATPGPPSRQRRPAVRTTRMRARLRQMTSSPVRRPDDAASAARTARSSRTARRARADVPMIGEANAPGVVPRAVDRSRASTRRPTTWRVTSLRRARAIRRAILFKSLTRARPFAGTSSCTTTRGATSSPTTTRRARGVCRSRR